jgi:hypothetical protein
VWAADEIVAEDQLRPVSDGWGVDPPLIRSLKDHISDDTISSVKSPPPVTYCSDWTCLLPGQRYDFK